LFNLGDVEDVEPMDVDVSNVERKRKSKGNMLHFLIIDFMLLCKFLKNILLRFETKGTIWEEVREI
jgi:hypothetical protein